MDTRYELAKARVKELTHEEKQRILDNIDIICFDTFNYDEEKQQYCPIAIAMNLHNTVEFPSNNIIEEEISKRFQPVNIFKGVTGSFYTNNRKEDLINLINNMSELTFNDYQTRAITTKIYPPGLAIPYVTLGLMGEAGEVAEKVKKVIRDENGVFTDEKKKELAKEIGDVLWYSAALADEIGWSISDIAQGNIEKLEKRKAEGKLGGSGDNR